MVHFLDASIAFSTMVSPWSFVPAAHFAKLKELSILRTSRFPSKRQISRPHVYGFQIMIKNQRNCGEEAPGMADGCGVVDGPPKV